MWFTYLLVFNYTKNGNSYFTNTVIYRPEPFSIDDMETEERIASAINNHKCRIINIILIEKKP